MEIVIDIDENVFTRLFDNGIEDYAIVNDDLFAVAKSIRKCTPLPKHLNKIKAEIEALSNANPSYTHTCDVVDREDVIDIIDKYIEGSESE